MHSRICCTDYLADGDRFFFGSLIIYFKPGHSSFNANSSWNLQESVPLELDAMLLTEPIASYLPFRIRQGLIETYSLYLDDLEHHSDEQERVLRAIRGEVGAEIASEAVIDRPILSNELQQIDADLQPSPSVLLPKN